jgi:membrane protein
VGFKDRLEGMPVIGTALAVQERYKLDGADPFAAAIGFFAFLSLFPLLALAVSVAGFVLDDPADQVAVAESLTQAIPGFEATMEDGDGDSGVAALVEGVVEQRGTIGLVGIVLLLLSGLRVINGAMIATRVVFRGEPQQGIMAKVRQVGALVGLGALALLGVAGSSLAGIGIGQLPAAASVVLSLAITFAFDLLLFVGAYTLLSPTSTLTVRQLVPGAVLAATGWTVLKVAGASYVSGQVENANALYGALGGVIALMLLFYLAGRLYLYGAELNAVKVERVAGPLTAAGPASNPAAADADRGSEARAANVSDGTAAHASDAELRAAAPSSGWDGPPAPPRLAFTPRPTDPGPTGSSPTIRATTQQQLTVHEERRLAEAETRSPGSDARQTIALALGAAALAAGYRWLRSDSD